MVAVYERGGGLGDWFYEGAVEAAQVRFVAYLLGEGPVGDEAFGGVLRAAGGEEGGFFEGGPGGCVAAGGVGVAALFCDVPVLAAVELGVVV